MPIEIVPMLKMKTSVVPAVLIRPDALRRNTRSPPPPAAVPVPKPDGTGPAGRLPEAFPDASFAVDIVSLFSLALGEMEVADACALERHEEAVEHALRV